MKKVMVIFGTRPEAIKLAATIQKLKEHSPTIETVVCVTAQHREMLDQVLDLFQIRPDYDLNIMRDDQSLFGVTARALLALREVLEKEKPNMVLVQGDTTTTFMGALAAFYLKIPVGHVEAGLRTNDKYQPFPEEINRKLTSSIADLHFAPTERARQNLLTEGVSENVVFVTGNPVIDALLTVVKGQEQSAKRQALDRYFQERWKLRLPSDGASDGRRLIAVSGHRRENFGQGFRNICVALKEIAELNPDVVIVYPVHLNPNVQKPVYEILGSNALNSANVFLIDPLDYEPFVYLMNRSYLVLTDSGGVQEEAPALGKPVLVMRKETERPEAVVAGTVKIVGTEIQNIVSQTEVLLNDHDEYNRMAQAVSPYGDGHAAERIVEIISRNI